MRTRPRRVSAGEAIWMTSALGAASGAACDGCGRSDRPTKLLPFSVQTTMAEPVSRGHVVLCITCATKPAQAQVAIRKVSA
jgi:hypothetical protein